MTEQWNACKIITDEKRNIKTKLNIWHEKALYIWNDLELYMILGLNDFRHKINLFKYIAEHVWFYRYEICIILYNNTFEKGRVVKYI